MTVKTQDAIGAYALPILAVAFGVGLLIKAAWELIRL